MPRPAAVHQAPLGPRAPPEGAHRECSSNGLACPSVRLPIGRRPRSDSSASALRFHTSMTARTSPHKSRTPPKKKKNPSHPRDFSRADWGGRAARSRLYAQRPQPPPETVTPFGPFGLSALSLHFRLGHGSTAAVAGLCAGKHSRCIQSGLPPPPTIK